MNDTPRKKVKSIFSPRHQRFAGVCLSIIAQILILLIIFVFFSQIFVYFYAACFVLSVLVSLYISTRKGKLAYKVAWIIPLLLFPLLGGAMYLILGGNRKLHYPQEEAKKAFQAHLSSNLSVEELSRYGVDAAQQAWYLEHSEFCPAYDDTETTYYPRGEDFFPVLFEELEKAERYIFLEYFIIAEGEVWNKVLDILVRKAAQGVDVRIIFDGIGSAAALPMDYPKRMARRGIKCKSFQPFRPVLSIHQNNRDHRKICVIDGVTGFVGGLNLGDEYMNLVERFGYWKDNALRLRGEAVWSLTIFFLTMWNAEGEREDYRAFRPEVYPSVETSGGFVVPYADTPMPDHTLCADLHLMMITKAKRYCYITTPYLSIDETITAALCTAARAGVDVRIMTPHIPDKKVVFAVTQSNYPGLLEAGVRIFEFTPGFLHSKTVVADDLYASVGSCNLDYRSFYLQFENGVWLCGDPAVLSVKEDFLKTQQQCQEITLADIREQSLFKRVLYAVYRLFAPVF